MQRRGVNLIPEARRRAKRCRRRMLFWAKTWVVYAALWAAAYAAADLVTAGDDRALRRERDQVMLDLDSANKGLSAMRDRIGAGRSRLQAGLMVGGQPDWSLLLAYLAETTGDEAVLRGVRLDVPTGGVPAAAKAEAEGPAPVKLELTGFGRTQTVVTELVLRLEQTPIFERVRLIDTRREPFRSGTAVAFRIECVLTAAPEDAA